MTMKFTVEFEFKKLRMQLQKMVDGFPSEVAQSMRTSGEYVLVPAIRNILRKNHSIFTGELHSRQTVSAGMKDGGKTPYIDVGAAAVNYGLAVEKGTGPHKPNENRIREYARKKMGYSGVMLDQVTAAIMDTIEAVGTVPHPHVMPAFDANKSKFFQDIVRRMNAWISRTGASL